MHEPRKSREALLAEIEALQEKIAALEADEPRTARARVEEALRESEERYREIFENANDIIYTHDLNGRFTSINKAGEDVTGYSRAETLEMNISEVVAPEWLSLAREMISRKIIGEERTRYEIEIIAKDGRRITLEVSTRLMTVEGRPAGIQGIARDISDRKRTEEALRQSEERFRTLVEHSSDAIALVSADAVVLYASRSTSRVLGYSVEEYVGRSMFELIHQDDRERLDDILAKCLQTPGVPAAAEYRFLHKDGTWRYMEGVAVNRLEVAGIGAIVFNCRDISDRKRSEDARRESDEQFRAVFEAAPIGMVRLDVEGRILECNRALEEMFGYTRDELRERTVTDFAPSEEVPAIWADLKDLVSGKRDHYRAERRYLRRDGTPIWVHITAALVRDSAGRPQFSISMAENISERKEAEDKLRQSHRRLAGWVTELEQRNREMSLLSEMGDLLQACRSAEEAYEVIARMGRQFFPTEAGAVCAIGNSHHLVEAVATWGEPCGERLFAPDECWALRRGRLHLVDDAEQRLICRHVDRRSAAPYLCVPMMAQGAALGLLHLRLPETAREAEAKQRLALTVAEHIALALANLRLHESLRSQSIRDPLTALFNRRYMEESLAREMARAARGRHPVSIIMMDLDNFKRFNDEFGHEAGDELLCQVGGVLQQSIRADDIACRYGGEEFTLILPEVELADAVARAEHVRQAIKTLNVQHRRQVLGRVTISAGVAMYPDHGPASEAVLRAADAALYQAKAAGRDRVVAYVPASAPSVETA